jgi:hypothetical protein
VTSCRLSGRGAQVQLPLTAVGRSACARLLRALLSLADEWDASGAPGSGNSSSRALGAAQPAPEGCSAAAGGAGGGGGAGGAGRGAGEDRPDGGLARGWPGLLPAPTGWDSLPQDDVKKLLAALGGSACPG